jgi:hypothetical protein
MRTTGFKVTGLFEQQSSHECDDQCGSQEIEGVAEGQDESLFLHDLADRYHGAERCVRRIENTTVDEILRELFDPRAGRLFEQRDRRARPARICLIRMVKPSV